MNVVNDIGNFFTGNNKRAPTREEKVVMSPEFKAASVLIKGEMLDSARQAMLQDEFTKQNVAMDKRIAQTMQDRVAAKDRAIKAFEGSNDFKKADGRQRRDALAQAEENSVQNLWQTLNNEKFKQQQDQQTRWNDLLLKQQAERAKREKAQRYQDWLAQEKQSSRFIDNELLSAVAKLRITTDDKSSSFRRAVMATFTDAEILRAIEIAERGSVEAMFGLNYLTMGMGVSAGQVRGGWGAGAKFDVSIGFSLFGKNNDASASIDANTNNIVTPLVDKLKDAFKAFA